MKALSAHASKGWPRGQHGSSVLVVVVYWTAKSQYLFTKMIIPMLLGEVHRVVLS